MNPRISSFVSPLPIPTAQADTVANIFSNNSNVAAFLHEKSWDASALTIAACAALKLILGDNKVFIDCAHSPENWQVTRILECNNFEIPGA